MPHSPLSGFKVDDWEQMRDVNFKRVLYGIAAVLPHMKAQRSGHIEIAVSPAETVYTSGNCLIVPD
jgi:NADP-dependent 3-hydroxy acid dehydrogenase YdfG